MKLLSIVVPCYNSQEYMHHCIESLLPGSERVEIIIVNDGSTDDTAQIAEAYACQYPDIIKAIHQENGGHGEAVNTGLRGASGLYFKVVDSDDWVDMNAYRKILDTLETFRDEPSQIDMFISNYVYEKDGAENKKVMQYNAILPQGRVFSWEEVKRFPKGRYILMHSVIYRTQLLRDCGLKLPKHTFYVDNLFVYIPLPYVKKMYYLNENFYRYYIGRDDQSVNEQVMIRRIDQQIKVNKLMLEYMNSYKVANRKIRSYMFHYLEIITIVTTTMLIRSGTRENLQKKKELWKYIKETDRILFYRLRNGILGVTMNLPGRVGRRISVSAYKISQKVVGFN